MNHRQYGTEESYIAAYNTKHYAPPKTEKPVACTIQCMVCYEINQDDACVMLFVCKKGELFTD